MEPYAAIDSLCVNARSSTPWLTIEFDVPRQQRFETSPRNQCQKCRIADLAVSIILIFSACRFG